MEPLWIYLLLVVVSGGSILSLGNTGSTFSQSETYSYQSGTSMSAPFVSGVAALMFSVNNGLFPDQIEKILQDTSSSFARAANCDSGCGSGILNARLAVYEARDTQPDATYSEADPISAGSGEESKTLSVSNDDKGGICGTIDTNSASGGGNGPLSLIIFFFLAMIMTYTKQKKLERK